MKNIICPTFISHCCTDIIIFYCQGHFPSAALRTLLQLCPSVMFTSFLTDCSIFFSAFSLPCLASPYLTQKHPPHKGAGVTQVPKVVQQALLPSPQRHNYAQATATLFLFLVVVPRLKNIHHFCQMSIEGAKSGQVLGTAALPSLI